MSQLNSLGFFTYCQNVSSLNLLKLFIIHGAITQTDVSCFRCQSWIDVEKSDCWNVDTRHNSKVLKLKTYKSNLVDVNVVFKGLFNACFCSKNVLVITYLVRKNQSEAFYFQILFYFLRP